MQETMQNDRHGRWDGTTGLMSSPMISQSSSRSPSRRRGATWRWTGHGRDPDKRLRRVATVNKRRTVSHWPAPPTAIRRPCRSDTITINYCWTPCRGNQAFVSSYVGGDRSQRQRPPVQAIRIARRRTAQFNDALR